MLPRLERIAATIGPDAVRAERDGRVRVTPPTTDAMAGLLGLAHDEGWLVAVEGASSWQPDLPTADLIVSTRGLDDVSAVATLDDAVSVPAGIAMDLLRATVREADYWLALDPPGRPDRTIGSVLATATAGPLRAGFGPMRNQVLALTVVTGDGRVVRPIADPGSETGDLPSRLHLGGFGAFGIITEATLRVHEVPEADVSYVAHGSRDVLTAAARELAHEGLTPAAAELMSPALAAEGEWLLAIRFIGTADMVHAESARLMGAGRLPWQELPEERRTMVWNASARGISTVPVTLRVGVLPEGIDDAIDLIVEEVGEGMLSAGAMTGMIRWSGHAAAESLREMRNSFASRESPLTLERASWELRRAVGHSGMYREGIDGPIAHLRTTYDPRNILVTGITGEHAI